MVASGESWVGSVVILCLHIGILPWRLSWRVQVNEDGGSMSWTCFRKVREVGEDFFHRLHVS